MTLNDIVALSKAGFTAEQITKLSAAEVQTPVQTPVQQPFQFQIQPTSTPVQTPVQQPVQQPFQFQIQPTPTPVQAPVMSTQQAQTPVQPAQQETEFDQIMRSLGLLNQSIQSNNILNANQQQPETVDDIIASIINPPEPDNKKGDVNNG